MSFGIGADNNMPMNKSIVSQLSNLFGSKCAYFQRGKRVHEIHFHLVLSINLDNLSNLSKSEYNISSGSQEVIGSIPICSTQRIKGL